MPKGRWVVLCGFCSKFYKLSNSAKFLKISLRFDKVRESLKVGTFFETQCSSTRKGGKITAYIAT